MREYLHHLVRLRLDFYDASNPQKSAIVRNMMKFPREAGTLSGNAAMCASAHAKAVY